MLNSISLFTGVGGLDLGFEAAGFTTRVAVEIDPLCCKTLRLNRPWPVIQADIHDTPSKHMLRAAALRPGQPDVLIGGPPCQPFSKAGYWLRGETARLQDPKAKTLSAYLRVVHDTRPKVLLLENVWGMTYGNSEGLQRIINGIRNINAKAGTKYKPAWRVIDAADYGAPQHRERVFIIASRDGRDFKFPDPTHAASDDERTNRTLEPYRTAWDALGDLPARLQDPELQLRGKWADLIPSIPEGHNYLWHTSRGGGLPLFGWRTRYWSFLLKLAKHRPSWTIQAQPGPATGPFHWSNRQLSPQELCRLQTLPDGLRFECTRNEAQRMLGNAVPSLLAEVLAREIRSQLLDRPMRSPALKLLPPQRQLVGKRSRPRPVPTQYIPLVGSHADHPGESLGPRAKKRHVTTILATEHAAHVMPRLLTL